MPGKTQLTDQEFVENIVKAIVDFPDEVVTGRTLDERGVLIQLTVNREDMGKVIGREGRTAKAIRSLLRVFGARNEERINLKIVDPEGEVASIPEENGEMSAQQMVATPAPVMAAPAPTPAASSLDPEITSEPMTPLANEDPVEEKSTSVI